MTESKGIYARRGSLLIFFQEAMTKDTNECIIWPYHKGSHGYGVLTVDGKQQCAHVLACEHRHGPRPGRNFDAAHMCNVKACINPRHIRWLTQKQNIQEAWEQWRNK